MTQRSGGVRARDSDRVDVCAVLDAALADGQLSSGEHTARTATAMRAKSFDELDALVADLQIPANLVDAPIVRVERRAPGRWRGPAAIVAGAAVLGLLAGLLTRCDGPGSGPDRQVPILTEGPGIAHFLDAYRAEFGTPVVDEVTFYPEYVLFDRAVPDDPRSTGDYRYDGEFSSYSTVSTRESGVPTMNLDELDLYRLAGLIAGAPRTVGVPDGAVSHIIVEYEAGAIEGAAPIVRMYVSNAEKKTGFLETALDGEPIRVSPPS